MDYTFLLGSIENILDGYADQFGGLKGKKFMYRQFKETLIGISHEPMNKQKELLDQKIEALKSIFL